VSALNKANNIFYVCSPTPLQRALSEVLMTDPRYYTQLGETFAIKRKLAIQALEQVGFEIYDSGSSFYVWARIPEEFEEAMQLNEMLIDRAQVAGVPGSAFAESNDWNNYMRLCIAREDGVLQGAFAKIQHAFVQASSVKTKV
jgi:aspartate/methionine/tyrosine aminotransferase